MSTRACYRFIDPDTSDPEVVTVYKHSDGYPDGAVCWITKALEHAWPLPRFEVDEFAAAFVAANKPSAKTRRMDYIAKAERETDPERKLNLLKAAEDYGPGGRYADCIGGGVGRLSAFIDRAVGQVWINTGTPRHFVLGLPHLRRRTFTSLLATAASCHKRSFAPIGAASGNRACAVVVSKHTSAAWLFSACS